MLLACALLASGASGCGEPEAPSTSPPPDVVVLLLDTLRVDHLPMYGYERALTPTLDALRAESTLFARAYSTSSLTPPAVASLFTGVYPQEHGVFEVLHQAKAKLLQAVATHALPEDDPTNLLPPSLDTLPERLKRLGYRTFAVFTNPNVGQRTGYAEGFDRWVEIPKVAPGADKVIERLAELEPDVHEAAPRFVYVHFMDPHAPYHLRDEGVALPGSAPPASPPVVDLYDREIRFMDRHLRALLDRLRLRERTLLVIASDHGEELRDRGEMGHGRGLFAELNRAVLLVRAPWVEGAPRTVRENVSLIDLMPTIMEAVGHPIGDDEPLDGLSLWPLLDGDEAERAARADELAERTLFAHRRAERLSGETLEVWSAQRGDWRLIVDATETDGPRRMLFDHAKDPAERNDLSAEQPERIAALEAEVERYRARPPGPWERQPLELTDEVQAQLEALGYADPEP